MPFTLVPSKLFLAKLKKLDKSVVMELEKKLERLKENPVCNEHRMHYARNFYRVYPRNFRIIYKVENEKIILFDMLKRKEGY